MGMLDNELLYDELEVEIGEKKYKLKANFRGLRETENRAFTGISGLLQKFATGSYGVNDVASIVYGGIIGSIGPKEKPPITFEDLANNIIDHGVENLVDDCNNLIIYAYTGKMPDELEREKPKKKALKD